MVSVEKVVFSAYIDRLAIRSQKTAILYRNHIKLWAHSRSFTDPDKVIEDIKTRGLDPYVVLQEWVTHLHQRGKAPKTIHSTVSSIKGFLIDSDIDVSAEKVKSKVTMPKAYETSVDRAPTADEIRRVLLRSKLDTKAAITVMATSGLRIGELCSMRVSDIHFGEKGEPSKITLRAAVTKSRRKRITFCSGEATEFLKEHLGGKVNDPNLRVFGSEDSIYCKIMRALILAGLRVKEDADSTRYSLHPHTLRKYFYTNMLASSVDRGIVKGFMGHSIDLDASYLRMTDDQLKEQWLKGADRMVFLSPIVDASTKSRLEQVELDNQRLREDFDKASMFLRHVNEYWQPKPLPPKKGVVFAPDFAKMGLKWPLDGPKKQTKREKT